MIELDGIERRQGDFQLSVSLSLAAGRRLALIGPSGAGKSTLLGVLTGFVQPDAGRVMIGGADVTQAEVADRPVSILFQDGNLFPHLSVAQNVGLGQRPDLRLNAADWAAVEESLAQVGLAGFGPRRPADLSGGQAARVALARVLLQGKPVLVMDEPFAALDPGLRVEMAGLVEALCTDRAITLILVAHELRGLDGLVTDLCLLAEGRVAAFGAADTLRTDPPPALLPWL
ncbi:MAG: ATP-binding cassette domain-containing protein [Pseudomonadota bacterium]